MKVLFWISVLMIFYTYVGYPCLLYLWATIAERSVRKEALTPEPTVTVVIAARNEERNIGRRIQNLLDLEYSQDKMEIIIVSDGSSDRTVEMVEEMIGQRNEGARLGDGSGPQVKLIKVPQNRGKSNALNLALREATGGFIVFTDVRQEFEKRAIRELLWNFSDETIGCVSGELILRNEARLSSAGEEVNLYWNLEKWIRKTESRIHSVAGATGAIYAIRRESFREIPEETILDDVLIPMRLVLGGRRCVFEEQAVAYDTVSKDLSQEKRRKVRTLAGNYQLLRIAPELLSPKKNPIFLQFVSHKVLRLFIPFFFIGMFVSSIFLDELLYKMSLVCMVTVLIAPLFHRLLVRVFLLRWVSVACRAFVSLNYFAFLALFYAVWPSKKNLW